MDGRWSERKGSKGGRGRGRCGWEVEGEEGKQAIRRQRKVWMGGRGRGRHGWEVEGEEGMDAR